MIAYEELERALARWKARRSGAVEMEQSRDADLTPPGKMAGASSYPARDHSGELDLVDAELDEN
jgi:hypothetical protein